MSTYGTASRSACSQSSPRSGCCPAGLAIQTNSSPASDGAFFGPAHLWYLRRAGATWPAVAGAALLWVVLGVAPTALVVAIYRAHGPAAFHAFWFANFESIFQRAHYAYPPGLPARRLLAPSALLLALTVSAALSGRAD